MPEVDSVSQLEEYLPTTRESQMSGLTQWQLDCKDMIEEYKHQMRGEEYDPEEGVWKSPKDTDGKPFMKSLLSERGLLEVVSMMNLILTKNTFLSNMNEFEVYAMTKWFADNLTETLYHNYDNFQINPDSADYHVVTDSAITIVLTALLRAKDQGERAFLKSAERRIIHEERRPDDRKGGGFLSIFGR